MVLFSFSRWGNQSSERSDLWFKVELPGHFSPARPSCCPRLLDPLGCLAPMCGQPQWLSHIPCCFGPEFLSDPWSLFLSNMRLGAEDHRALMWSVLTQGYREGCKVECRMGSIPGLATVPLITSCRAWPSWNWPLLCCPLGISCLWNLLPFVLSFQVYLWETCLRDFNHQHDCKWRGVLQPGGGAPHP